MFPEVVRHSQNGAKHGDLEDRSQAAGRLGLFRRRPVVSAVLIVAADIVIAVLAGLAAKALLPPIPMLPDFIALGVVAAATLVLVSVLGWWRAVGCNWPAEWRDPKLMLLPAVLVFLPLVAGFKAVDAGTLIFLLAGYLLTGFYEETLFRGVILRMLLPKGVWPAVLLSSLLFALAHSTNLFLRFSGQPTLVGLQMIGTFTFGVGMAALRLRTNTLWPLMLLHAATGLCLALGRLPVPLVAAIGDAILLVYAFFLLRGMPGKNLRVGTRAVLQEGS